MYEALFDTGSPISFIRRSQLPFDVPTELKPSDFRGLGGQNIQTLGEARCQIRFKNRVEEIKLIILPEESMLLPLILGRDFLNKFNVFLSCIKRRYTKEKLLKLNDTMSSELTNRTYFCAPLSNGLTVAARFDLCRNMNEPMQHTNASHCNSANDILNIAPDCD